MSVFPDLPGVQIGIKKSSQWATIVQTTASGREIRSALQSQPLYNFELPYSFLRRAPIHYELQTLQGFINTMRGAWDSWLYSDPTDRLMENSQIGTGDGRTTTFQLQRTYGGFTEPVANPDVDSFETDPLMWAADETTLMWPFWQPVLMWLGGSGLGDFTISNPGGVVTFAVPPPANTPIYATGGFYYRCRFMEDNNEFGQGMVTYWTHQGLQFKASLGLKI